MELFKKVLILRFEPETFVLRLLNHGEINAREKNKGSLRHQ